MRHWNGTYSDEPPTKPEGIHVHIPVKVEYVPAPVVREGDIGTWSHCGMTQPHPPHTHTIVFNEGPYPDVMCNGT